MDGVRHNVHAFYSTEINITLSVTNIHVSKSILIYVIIAIIINYDSVV